MSAESGRSMMLKIAEEIERSVSALHLHVALLTALTIPDICGAIDSRNGCSTGANYAGWFDKYVAPKYPPSDSPRLTGDDCYRCRCRLLHQGRTTGPGRYAKFELLFDKQANVADFGVWPLDDEQKLLIEVPVLCRNVAYAVYDWLEVVEDTPLFETNTEDAVRMLRLSFGS